MTTLEDQLSLPQYPRSAAYDPEWVLSNLMGPNVLWLTEALTQKMNLQPGMRVLDMGCGTALSSIFLAREFGVTVWATDLWISASDNWARIREAGVENQVYPIHSEAHELPFAQGFFDAAVSLDAYHYFGTDNLFLSYFAPFMRPGAELGIVAPGLVEEMESDLPEHLHDYWDPDFYSFHSPDWWARHWSRSGQVMVNSADLLPEGWREWLLWEQVCKQHGYRHSDSEREMLEVDHGRTLGFVRIVAEKS